MKLDITKIANTILYMLDKDVPGLNDKKLCIFLFLIDYENFITNGNKIYSLEYIKQKRNPEPPLLSEIFDIIANGEDLEEDDERLYLITELLDYLDIEIITKKDFIELKFIKMEEDFDPSIFSKEEMATINKVVEKYKDFTPRKIANACFEIEKVRETALDNIII